MNRVQTMGVTVAISVFVTLLIIMVYSEHQRQDLARQSDEYWRGVEQQRQAEQTAYDQQVKQRELEIEGMRNYLTDECRRTTIGSPTALERCMDRVDGIILDMRLNG